MQTTRKQPSPTHTHTQVAFSFGTHALPPDLSLSPPAGLVAPKSHALVALRYAPVAAPAAFSLALPVTYNHTPVNAASLRVAGACHAPLITTSLAPGSRLFLRPTCVGGVSSRRVEVINPGRVPAGWRWVLSRRLTGVVAVSPQVRAGGRGHPIVACSMLAAC